MTMRSVLVCLLAALTLSAVAQKKGKGALSGYDRSARATVLHPAIVYIGPDETSQKVAEVTPGHELVIIDRSGPWVKVFANTDEPDRAEDAPEFSPDEEVTPASGWVKDKGLVTPQTANGDLILYGAAANLEDLAERPHAPKDAATGAHLLYRRVYEYFPSSNLSAEAAFRSADIRWQLEKQDNSSLPSTKEQDAYLRPQLYEGEMKKILKNYPQSDQAAEAAYDLLDNKVCGDWQGLPHCPEMEADLYLKYADRWQSSPKAAEALYNAVYRWGVLVTMYDVQDEHKRAQAAADRVQKLTAQMQADYANSDYTKRAESLAFRVKQGLSIYGNDRE